LRLVSPHLHFVARRFRRDVRLPTVQPSTYRSTPKEPAMNRSLSTQLSALGLAAFVTLSLMGGIQHLATITTPADTMAQAAPASAVSTADAAAAQVVVITGKRMVQG
jgi:hypothetical protein